MSSRTILALLFALAGCNGSIGNKGADPDAAPGGGGGGGGSADAGNSACGTASFMVTETQEVFAVPADVTYLHVKAWGAGGNGESEAGTGVCGFDDGGLGGYSEAVFAVTAGDPLIIIVGKRGRSGMTGEERRKFGFGDWGGGGLSGVFTGADLIDETSHDRALVIAGGGGSASPYACHPGGTGNHADAGGMTTMQGGAGVAPPHDNPINGGGGGYLGGAGGALRLGSVGGTGFVAAAAIDSKMLSSEPGSHVAPNAGDVDYDGTAGTTETSGLVVLHFECAPTPIE